MATPLHVSHYVYWTATLTAESHRLHSTSWKILELPTPFPPFVFQDSSRVYAFYIVRPSRDGYQFVHDHYNDRPIFFSDV